MQRGTAKRILHVFGGMNRGGAETMIMNLYREIDRERIQFDFAVNTDQPCAYDDEIRALGGRIFPHPKPNQAGMSRYRAAFANTLRQNGPFQAVHSHVHRFSGVVLGVARDTGVPVRIAHSHTTQNDIGSSVVRKLYGWYMNGLLRKNATHFIGCGRAAAESLFGAQCWQDPRTEVLNNGIDLTPYASLPADPHDLRGRLGLPQQTPLIGHVGRFSTPKNHAFLIDLFAEVLERVPGAHLVLVGEGALREQVEAQIRQKGIGEQVHLLGLRSDVPQLLGSLDLFLFPSLYEGLPVSMVEAQAAGLPCVVSDTVTREVDLGAGLVEFVNLQSPMSQWTEAILQGLQQGRLGWPQRQRAIRAAGYDIEQTVQRLEVLYG